MFPKRYFAPHAFAPHYFAEHGAAGAKGYYFASRYGARSYYATRYFPSGTAGVAPLASVFRVGSVRGPGTTGSVKGQ